MELTGKKNSSGSSTLLAPGFRFHPTDEELVRYYLRRKVCRKTFRLDAISEVDVYKTEPWDLPSMSKLKTRDLEWYFFSVLDKKYGNGARTNRATEKGYWKTTGKDRAVYHRTQTVGMKKTLVYHNGRAPKGLRTNWVMHEYRLTDSDLERAGIVQDAYVLCRIFQKSGSGPKNGEQYGAPFVEEEWDFDEELELVSKHEAADEVDFGDDACLDAHDLEQILGSDFQLGTAPQINFQSTDGSCNEETAGSFNDTQKLLLCAGEQYQEPQQCENTDVVNSVKNECIGESSNSGNSDYLNFLLDEPFMDSSDNFQFGDGGFIEANDLSNPVETNTSTYDMLEEYLSFFDANDDKYFTHNPAMMLGSEDLIFDQAWLPQKELDQGTKQAILPSDSKLLPDKQESAKYQADPEYPFIKRASQMLGGIHAPSAFAAEFPPSKDVVRLNSAPQSPNVTAGMIQIRNLNMDGGGDEKTDHYSVKHESFDIVLSVHIPGGSLSGKNVSTISGGWFYSIFYLVLILSVGFKFGSFLCAT